MNSPPGLKLSLALGLLLASPLAAQWLHYPTAGVPRMPDGRLNSGAPPPRTAAGQPDFSGMWWIADSTPCPASILGDNGECLEKGLGLAGQPGAGLAPQAINIGSGLAGGLPLQPWAAELVRQRARELGKYDPHVRCLPINLPRTYTLPHLEKLIQTPGLLVILDEFNASYRQIFTDGRPLPQDPQPSWNGYSTAHWDGDTLVVETIGFRDDLWLDMTGNPLTSAAKVTERLHRPNFGSLEVDLTVDDPKAYTRPWTAHIKLFSVVDTEMMDEICLENEKSLQHMLAK